MLWWQILVTILILLFSFTPLFFENRLKYRSLAIGGGLLFLWSFIALPWVSLDVDCFLNELTGGFLPLIESLGIASDVFIGIFASDNIQTLAEGGSMIGKYAFNPSGILLYLYYPASHTNVFFYTLLSLPALYALLVFTAGILSFLPFFRGFHKLTAGLLSFFGLFIIFPLLVSGLPLIDSWGTTGEFAPGLIAWLLNAKLGTGLWLALLLALPMMIASGERIYAGVEDESSLGYESSENDGGNPLVALALNIPGKFWVIFGSILFLVAFFFLPWIKYDPIAYQSNLTELNQLPESINPLLCAAQDLSPECEIYNEPWPFIDIQVQEIKSELAQGSKLTGLSIFLRPLGSNLVWQIAIIGIIILAIINLLWSIIFLTQFDNSDDVPLNTLIVSISAPLLLLFFFVSLLYFPKLEVFGSTQHYQLGLLMNTALADVGIGALLALLASFLMMLGGFREILEFLDAESLRVVAMGIIIALIGGLVLGGMAMVMASSSESCALGGVVAPPTPTPTPTPNYPPTPFTIAPDEGSVIICPGGSAHTTWDATIPSAPQNTDILFAFDLSGSMGDTISAAQQDALSLMNELSSSMDNVRFGVVSFEDVINYPYVLEQPLTSDYETVEAEIKKLDIYSRAADEAHIRVMFEGYSDASIGWDSRARRYLVFFTDVEAGEEEPGRDLEYGTSDDLTLGSVVNKLKEENILVVLFTPDADLIPYWERDIFTTTGGTAALLSNDTQFADVVSEVITELSMQIDTLTVETAPGEYAAWVSAPSLPGMEIGSEDRTAQFDIQIAVPEGFYTPGTYPLTISALGDGVPYDNYTLNLIIPDDCPRP